MMKIQRKRKRSKRQGKVVSVGRNPLEHSVRSLRTLI